VNETDLGNASEKVTNLHQEVQERLERVFSGYKMDTIADFGELTHESGRA
jgi:hypothetical protein